jgi:putative transposase
MKSITRRGRKRKQKVMGAVKVVDRSKFDGLDVDSRITLIQELIHLGLLHIAEELKREVSALSGGWHQRKQEEQARRHGTNPGSVRLSGQRIPIRVPRLRRDGSEVPLESYTIFHEGGGLDEKLFRQVLYGVSCRNYERAAQAVPGAIGISKSSVSRSFIEATQEHLRAFQERDLSTLDVVVLLIDGKTFAEDEMVLAVAVTMEGQRVPVGFAQTETENSKAWPTFCDRCSTVVWT